MRARLAAAVAGAALLMSAVGAPAMAVPVRPAVSVVPPAPPIAVSLGDSYISGEGGRWAGNTNGPSATVDALGRTAYFDNSTHSAEVYPGCSRAAMSPIHFDADVTAINLACSGATTNSVLSGRTFKPGLDFYNDGRGHRGQAALLQEAATGANVKLIVVSIGANNFHFADVVRQCVTDFLTSSARRPNYCHDDATVRGYVRPAAVRSVRRSIVASLHNVRSAMRAAGHADGTYDVVMQLYPAPIPTGSEFRYPQTGLSRFTVGGCAVWNADADWFNDAKFAVFNTTVREAAAQSGLSHLHILDTSTAFTGRRLCETGVDLLNRTTVGEWTAPGAVDRLEWVASIRTISTLGSPYRIQEGVHPNYWGQRALAACIAQAWNGGHVRGGTCTRAGDGLVNGMPVMHLQ